MSIFIGKDLKEPFRVEIIEDCVLEPECDGKERTLKKGTRFDVLVEYSSTTGVPNIPDYCFYEIGAGNKNCCNVRLSELEFDDVNKQEILRII